ncbi:unnamed protein product [Amoebophrya sp. A25]|nr:unnamed protein product [Amoebophrya sp. A25]|eukprot:GSA25T00011538001.1
MPSETEDDPLQKFLDAITTSCALENFQAFSTWSKSVSSSSARSSPSPGPAGGVFWHAPSSYPSSKQEDDASGSFARIDLAEWLRPQFDLQKARELQRSNKSSSTCQQLHDHQSSSASGAGASPSATGGHYGEQKSSSPVSPSWRSPVSAIAMAVGGLAAFGRTVTTSTTDVPRDSPSKSKSKLYDNLTAAEHYKYWKRALMRKSDPVLAGNGTGCRFGEPGSSGIQSCFRDKFAANAVFEQLHLNPSHYRDYYPEALEQ